MQQGAMGHKIQKESEAIIRIEAGLGAQGVVLPGACQDHPIAAKICFDGPERGSLDLGSRR